MNLMSFLKKNRMKDYGKKETCFECPIEEQKKFIELLNEPEDYIDRSFFQYLCQKKLSGRVKYFIYDLAALILLPVYYVSLTVFSKCNYCKKSAEHKAVAFMNDIPHNLIPESLMREMQNMLFLNTEESYFLDAETRKFLRSIYRRHPFSPYFFFKVMMKVAMYDSAKINYSPQAILTYNEFSFTSSILTLYCSRCGMEHINIMHGEKIYFIRDSFFAFHRFYVWDEFYVKLFKKLRAEEKQFVIELPPGMKFEKKTGEESKYDFKYYLANETEIELKRIHQSLKILETKGYNVAIRPHPRYTNTVLLNKVISDIEIEEPESVGIEASVMDTKRVVALWSTVLNQGYNNGREVVIDDIVNLKKFECLKKLDYIGLSYRHTLLSDWMKK